MTWEIQAGALQQPRELGWEGRWEGSSRGYRHIYIYLWLIHVDVWQKLTQQ